MPETSSVDLTWDEDDDDWMMAFRNSIGENYAIATFEELKHPRKTDGKFAPKGQGGTGPAAVEEPKAESKSHTGKANLSRHMNVEELAGQWTNKHWKGPTTDFFEHAEKAVMGDGWPENLEHRVNYYFSNYGDVSIDAEARDPTQLKGKEYKPPVPDYRRTADGRFDPIQTLTPEQEAYERDAWNKSMSQVIRNSIEIKNRGSRYVIYHSIFDVSHQLRGHGIGTDATKHLVEFAKDLKKRTGKPVEIELEANITVGGYAWGLAGYKFATRQDRSDLRNYAVGRAKLLLKDFEERDAKHPICQQLRDTIAWLEARREGTWQPHDLATIGRDSEYRINWPTVAPDQYMFMGKDERDKVVAPMHVGKVLMLGSRWHGRLRV